MSVAASDECFKGYFFNNDGGGKCDDEDNVCSAVNNFHSTGNAKSISKSSLFTYKSRSINSEQQRQQQQRKYYPLTHKMLEAESDENAWGSQGTNRRVASSATPSLQQEMNLARRACWCNKAKQTNDSLCACCTSSEISSYKRTNLTDDNEVDVGADVDEVSAATHATVCNQHRSLCKNVDRNVTTDLNGAITTNLITNIRNNNNNNYNENIDVHTEAKQTETDVKQTENFITDLCLTDADNTAESSLVNEFLHCTREELLNCWEQFVAFCDSITIKHDDPRLASVREAEQQKRQENEKSRRHRAADESAARTDGPQFKLLTNKKFIALFIVCVFFSFVNRIEGRPNISTVSNIIMGAAGSTTPAGVDSYSDASAQRLSLPPGSNTLDTIPPTDLNSLPPNQQTKKLPLNADPKDRASLQRADDNDEAHVHDRYPLSQVDFDRVKTPFIIGIWILSASIAKIGFHMTPKLHLIFPESCLLIVVGVVIGVVLFFCTDVAVSPLTPNTFFFYMLPPIILDAGYFMPNRLFFDNLGTILLMAVIGTIFNIATIGGSLWVCGLNGLYGDVSETPKFLDTFLFASLISAVDPVAVLAVFEEIHVNEILYIVVFGESLLNDAVTVVMYHMMEVYNEIGISNIIAQDVVSGVGSFFVVAIGGTIIGIIWGFLTGLVTRFTDHVRVIEPIFIFVMAYLAYLNAEIFHMSGILAITFCGITMKNYVESNISQKSHTTVKYALKMLSSSSETIIFMFLGVATVNNSHVWNTWFVVLTIVFCSVFRVLGVIILTALANRFRLHKLSRVDQFVMSYGGLRGAVAFALVLLIDENVVKQKNMFITTTIAVIYFTVFLQGITIKPLVKILNVKRANKRKPTMNERIHERFMDHLMAGIEDIVGKTGNYNVRDKFKRFDNRFIRPLLIRDLKMEKERFMVDHIPMGILDIDRKCGHSSSDSQIVAYNQSVENNTTTPATATANKRDIFKLNTTLQPKQGEYDEDL